MKATPFLLISAASLAITFSTLYYVDVKAAPGDGSSALVSVISFLFEDETACANPGLDSDNDRLSDCQETNTGIFHSVSNTGTDPNNPDTDGDSISDGDEVLGTLAGLDLPAMGLNPLRKNILLEYDWFDDAIGCAAHSHRPTPEVISRFAAAFENSPVINPDGSTGITTINDYGQGGAFTGGNFINDDNGELYQAVESAEYIAHKALNFDANRNGYFHYVLMPHRYGGSNSSGYAEILGDDMIVSMNCYYSTVNTANTIMHELGHNLNIRHGGDTNCNYKPNYNSVMNYLYQFPGIDTNCDVGGDGVLDYSRDNNRDLNENSLDENLGICNAPISSIDWNSSGTIESNVSYDINSGDAFQSSNCGDTRTVLTDYDDWTNMQFVGLSDGDGQNFAPPEVISCTNTPLTN